jgi:two-component system phosphate regulon response regulator PhoB
VSDKLPPKILVIEHDEVLNTTLCNMIERYWFEVSRVKKPDEAIRIAEINPPNVVIISSRIKSISAIEMATRIKKIKGLKEVPVIFLTDPEEPTNNYTAIDSNLTELIQRPFTPNELMTSIRTLLRKSKPVLQDKIIKYNDIAIDLSTYKVFRSTKEIHLGPTEFKILQLFLQRPDNVYSRRQIIDFVWGVDKDIAPRTIDVHINRIRTLMKLDSKYDIPTIRTIRSKGYSLN